MPGIDFSFKRLAGQPIPPFKEVVPDESIISYEAFTRSRSPEYNTIIGVYSCFPSRLNFHCHFLEVNSGNSRMLPVILVVQ